MKKLYLLMGLAALLTWADAVHAMPGDSNKGSAGDNTVYVSDDDPCPPYGPVPSMNISPDKRICEGGWDTITVSGNFIDYSWSPMTGLTLLNDSTAIASPTVTTTYTVTGETVNGCFRSRHVKIKVDPSPSVSANVTNISCQGAGDGSIDITITSSTSYVIQWSNSVLSEDLAGLGAGTYTLTVTGDNACSTMASYTITEPAQLTATTGAIDANCSSTTGITWASASGGTPPYFYAWDATAAYSSNDTVTALSAGSYSVQVTDGNGCTVNGSATIQPAISCTKLTDGTCGITLSQLNQTIYCQPVAGATNYEYRLTDLSTGAVATRLRNSSQTNFLLTWVPTVTYGRTYSIEVRAYVSGQWGTWGIACNVTTPAFPTTQLQNAYCGIALTNLNSVMYCNTVIGATNYEYKVIDLTTGSAYYKLRGSSANNFYMTWIPQVTYNKTYSVEVRAYVGGVWGTYGNLCNVTTPAFPTTQLQTAYCGITLTNLNSIMYCNTVIGATNYQYKVTDLTTGSAYYKLRGSSANNFYMTWIPQVTYGRTYSVEVRAYVGGVWGSYGNACNVTTPAFPTTQLQTAYCGITLTSLNSVMYCNTVIGATNYQYKVTDISTGIIYYKLRGSSANNFYMSWIPQVTYNKTYSVEVRAYVGGVWGSYGNVCNVTTPSSARVAGGESVQADEETALVERNEVSPDKPVPTISLYPNPCDGNSFHLSLAGLSKEEATWIKIFNLQGQLLFESMLDRTETIEENFSLPATLPSSMYLLEVQNGNDRYPMRFVVQ